MAEHPFRPMLAFDGSLSYFESAWHESNPIWLMSTKLDGIRAIVRGGWLLSRSLKLIPNRHTQDLFARAEFEGLDGELIVGAPYGEGVFARTSSGVMSRDGEPDVTFHVLDCLQNPAEAFSTRFWKASVIVADSSSAGKSRLSLVKQELITRRGQIEELETLYVNQGYEGAILKNQFGQYKYGRSTQREAGMGKLKRFIDSEAVITGFEEMMHNDNPAKLDERGFTTRSSHRDQQRPAGMLGTLRCTDCGGRGWEFGVGSGFDFELRHKIWDDRDAYLGKIIKYKYLPVGTIDKPRHPVFLGFRDPIDM